MNPKINPASGKQGRTVTVAVSETLTPTYKPPGKLNGGQYPKDGNNKRIKGGKMVALCLAQIQRRWKEAPGNPAADTGTYAITVLESQIRMKLPEHDRYEEIIAKDSAPLSLLEWTKVWIKLDIFHAQQRIKVRSSSSSSFFFLLLRFHLTRLYACRCAPPRAPCSPASPAPPHHYLPSTTLPSHTCTRTDRLADHAPITDHDADHTAGSPTNPPTNPAAPLQEARRVPALRCSVSRRCLRRQPGGCREGQEAADGGSGDVAGGG